MASLRAEEKDESGELMDQLTRLTLECNQSGEQKALPKSTPSGLGDLQCHFNWKLFDMATSYTVAELISKFKLKEAEDMDSPDSWRLFIHDMLLSFCHAKESDFKPAEQVLDKCVEYAAKLERFSSGLMYVVDANRSCMDHLQGRHRLSKERVSKMTAFERLSNSDKAAVHGIRALSLMQLGVAGSKRAQEYIEKAIDLDPDHAEWHFLKGKALMRIRHLEHPFGCPTDEEALHLDKANSMNQNALYLVFLGQCMRDKARYLQFTRRLGMTPPVMIAYEQSLDYYTKALQMNSVTPSISIRCADAFAMMPLPFQRYGMAEACLQVALELDPDNSMVLQKAGTYYEVMRDWNRAQTCYERSIETAHGHGNFPASLKLLNLKSTLDLSFDPFPMIHDMMSKYTESPSHIVTQLILRGLFHYTRRGNMESAAMDFHEAIVTSRDDVEPNFMRISGYSCFRNTLQLDGLLNDLESMLRVMEQSSETEVQDQGDRLANYFIPVVRMARGMASQRKRCFCQR